MPRPAPLLSAIALLVLASAASLAQAPARERVMNRPDFETLLKKVSNWGRWGAADEMGAVNLITPARRKRALAGGMVPLATRRWTRSQLSICASSMAPFS